MKPTATQRFVLFSTPESRNAGVISLLAVAETLVCVVLYWLLWLKWGVTWHHWLIVAATPLVLMLSEASVDKGLMWFEKYFDQPGTVFPLTSAKGFGLQAISFVVTFGVAWYLANNWVAGSTGWPLIWRSAVIGLLAMQTGVALAVAVAGAGAGETDEVVEVGVGAVMMGVAVGVGEAVMMGVGAGAETGTIWLAAVVAVAGAATVTAAGGVIGIWFRAILTRSAATLSHPLPGLKAIPANWQHFIWHSDFRNPPELISGHNPTSFREVFDSFRGSPTLRNLLFAFIVFPIFYLPTLLWRWSIKSTAWFYLPLLWIGKGWENIHGEELLIWAKGYSVKWLNLIGMLLAAILLFGTLVALFVPGDYFDLRTTLNDAGAPMPVIGLAFVLDWQSLAVQPWQWFYLPSWVLTLFLFFVIDSHGTDIEKGANPQKHLRQLRFWMWVNNTRAILTSLGLFTALFYFLAAVDAWGQLVALLS